jgi:hypothetical protein
MAGNEKQREERLAAALRENLRKRKAQARETAVVPAERSDRKARPGPQGGEDAD